jgi:hypothetical protein
MWRIPTTTGHCSNIDSMVYEARGERKQAADCYRKAKPTLQESHRPSQHACRLGHKGCFRPGGQQRRRHRHQAYSWSTRTRNGDAIIGTNLKGAWILAQESARRMMAANIAGSISEARSDAPSLEVPHGRHPPNVCGPCSWLAYPMLPQEIPVPVFKHRAMRPYNSAQSANSLAALLALNPT